MIATVAAAKCPHCGLAPGDAPATRHPSGGAVRYDLPALAALAMSEKAYDETVKVRVSQEDIRKLVEKRRKGPR